MVNGSKDNGRDTSWIPRAETYTSTEVSVRFYGDTTIVTGLEATTGSGVAAKAHARVGETQRKMAVGCDTEDGGQPEPSVASTQPNESLGCAHVI